MWNVQTLQNAAIRLSTGARCCNHIHLTVTHASCTGFQFGDRWSSSLSVWCVRNVWNVILCAAYGPREFTIVRDLIHVMCGANRSA